MTGVTCADRPRSRTPTRSSHAGASWIDLVEGWFAALTEKQLRRGVHRSTRELEAAIRAYLAIGERAGKAVRVDQECDQILATLARFVTRISDSGQGTRLARRSRTRAPANQGWSNSSTTPSDKRFVRSEHFADLGQVRIGSKARAVSRPGSTTIATASSIQPIWLTSVRWKLNSGMLGAIHIPAAP